MSKKKGLPSMKQELRGVQQLFEELPDVAGQIAVDHAHDNFDKEQFQNKGKSEKWATRKKAPDKSKGHKNILVSSGDLRGSIDYDTGGNQVAIGSDLIYAEVHNEGGKHTPKRQYMGPSEEIDDEIEKYLDDQFDHLFK